MLHKRRTRSRKISYRFMTTKKIRSRSRKIARTQKINQRTHTSLDGPHDKGYQWFIPYDERMPDPNWKKWKPYDKLKAARKDVRPKMSTSQGELYKEPPF